jgi:ABC-2 type transport system ATP-binding protein
MTETRDTTIEFRDVSKFYGEILGVNRINLSIEPGITSLVGPNGAGKSTLMNLMTGLLRPSRGSISVMGISPAHPEHLFRKVGYCGQFDSFPPGMTGAEFIESYLTVHGFTRNRIEELTFKALERVGLLDASERKIAAYSKGMRQRIRLAQAMAHEPEVLILDEPLNGLDPMARAETIDLFKQFAARGSHLIISSHILHEVDMMSDTVVLVNNGYIVAEGQINEVRDEIHDHPIEVMVRCNKPAELAAMSFQESSILEARLLADKSGLIVRTADPDSFHSALNRIASESEIEIEAVAPLDSDLNAVYQYLIASDGGSNL